MGIKIVTIWIGRGKKLNIKKPGHLPYFRLVKAVSNNYTEYPSSFAVAAEKISGWERFKTDHIQRVPSVDPGFYNVQIMDENEIVYAGLIDRNENVVIPAAYSHIK